MYVNDQHVCVHQCSVIQFADDTTIYGTGLLPDIIQNANADLIGIWTWFCANRMAISPTKTAAMLISNFNARLPPILPDIKLAGSTVPLSDSIKPLGITIDKHLSWHQHCTNLQQKLAKAMYLLRRVKGLLPIGVMKQLYYAIFHSHLLYGVALWGGSHRWQFE